MVQVRCFLVDCLDDLLIVESRVFKGSTVIALLSVTPFTSVSTCLIYLDALMLGTYIFITVLLMN